MLSIVAAPNPILSRKAKKITKIDKTIRDLIDQMGETLINAKDPEGVGLAAPQINKPLQLFIVKQSQDAPILPFINPEILITDEEKKTSSEEDKKTKKSVKLEGCLSLINIWGVVKRQNTILLSYFDEKGEYHKKNFSGFIATIIQHEVDHLNGILFPKRVLDQSGTLYKSSKNEKNESVFEELTI